MWDFVEGSCISGNQKKGTTFIRKPDNKKGTLLLSSYAIYGRMLLTWLLFRSRAPVVVLGSKLLLPMRSSWPVFPGLDQDLFPPRFSSFFGIRFQKGAKECIVQISARAFQRVFTCKNRRRYSRERAPRSLGENIQYYSLVSLVQPLLRLVFLRCFGALGDLHRT